jgi:hypothetical protein
MKELSFRAGVTLTSGNGLLRPIHHQSSWPLEKIVLNESGIEARAPFVLARLGFSMEFIEWERVQTIQYCLLGLRIVYTRQVTYELEIIAPCAYEKTMSFLRQSGKHQHLLADPTSNPKTPLV